MKNIEIRNIQELELDDFSRAMSVLPWYRDSSLYSQYIAEQKQGKREFIIAILDGQYVGHTCLIWDSKYHYFKEYGVPEISDLLVLHQYQRQGIAKRLILHCEKLALSHSKQIGLGVGLYKDYAPAQNLYLNLGYRLDCQGATTNYQPITPGEMVKVDDDLVIWLIKDLK